MLEQLTVESSLEVLAESVLPAFAETPRYCIELLMKTAARHRKRSIAVHNQPHRYKNSHAVRDHTALPATQQRLHYRIYPSQS